MQSNNITALPAPATAADFSAMSPTELRMARDALKNAAAFMNLTSSLANHMTRYALEDWADDWQALLDQDRDRIEDAMRQRGLSLEEEYDAAKEAGNG